jgi:hypothetical protein
VAKWFGPYLTDRKQKTEIKSFLSKWGRVKHGVPKGSILGPLLYIICINDLPPTMDTLSEPITFADNTSVIISSKNFDFSAMSNTVFFHMSKKFTSNKLVLNLDKTNIIKFITNKSPQYELNISYDGKYIEESINTKFLGLKIDNHLTWKNHTDLIPKLSRAYYAIGSLSHINSSGTLKIIYFAYFHSIMKYGIIFGVIPLTVKELFSQTNASIYSVNTRNRKHLCRPTVNLPCFRKSTYCTGIKIFKSTIKSQKSYEQKDTI